MRGLLARRAWLFDMDGTLVDTTALHAAAFREALRHGHAHRLLRFDYADLAGRPTEDAFRSMGIEEAFIEELTRRKREAYRARLRDAGDVCFAGARELLRHLRERGKTVVVVTGAARASAAAVMEASGLSELVRGVVAAEDTARGKPHPDPYEHALDRFGLDAADALVVEDSDAGVESARAAGIELVLVHRRRPDVPSFDSLVALHDALLRSGM